ncbi:MAG: hypothetical protein K8T90_03070 [Planctomycetes bacterium]|nr:hypothetical protein [Planctomycetota bacterium]
MDVFIDVDQYRRIGEAQSDANSSVRKVARLDQRIAELERRVDRQALASQALWEILRERLGLTDAVIFDKMTEIDLRDGVADGRISPRVSRCAGCGRAVNSARPKCIYCGKAAPPEYVAE